MAALNHLSITMASSPALLRPLLLIVLFIVSAATAGASRGPRPLFREYIGAEFTNVTFADVPVHPGVDFHFILSFAIDYAVDNATGCAHPTDGRFAVFWDEAHLTPAAVAALRGRGGNVRVALSLGGDTVGPGANATFRVLSSVDTWVANAAASLAGIAARYGGLDGVDVDYEHFGARETPAVFAECVGRLVRRLKADGVISFASIAPFADPDVQAHYTELWRRYGCDFDYVNFQFYAYAANTTVDQFLGYYDEQSCRYGGGGENKGKVLVGFGTDPASNGLGPGKGFFRACRVLRRQGRLHGVFVWAADNSVANGFRYERRAQRFLAGAAPGFE